MNLQTQILISSYVDLHTLIILILRLPRKPNIQLFAENKHFSNSSASYQL